MTAEEGARALYEAGRPFQLEELARTLDMSHWLLLLAAHKRCAAAARWMARCRAERLQMLRIAGIQHPAELEEQQAMLQLMEHMLSLNLIAAGPEDAALQQLQMLIVSRAHNRLADACPAYLA